jgi:hypothetical protein
MGLLIFLGAYCISAPLIGAIVQDDITNLRGMLSGLGFISKIFDVALGILEKVAAFSFV